MRSLFTRLAALSVIVAITGCVGSTGTAVPVAGIPNAGQAGAGNSQPNLTTPGGTGGITVPPNTIFPLEIDNGTLGAAAPAATYVGALNANAVDTQSAVQAPADVSSPNPAPTFPPNPNGAGDLGSHNVVVSNITQATVLITSNLIYNLTYSFGGQLFDYSSLVAHFAATAGTVPSSVSVEFASPTNSNVGFDVRAACTGASALGATFVRFTCPIPAYGVLPSTNVSGPFPFINGATGIFVPSATKIYFVLSYASVPAAAATTTFGIDYVYLLQ